MKNLSDGSSNIFHKMGMNFKKNATMKVVEESGYVIIGGFIYPFFPTALKGWFKINTDGWLGVFLGASASIIVGMLSDKMGIAAGGLGAMVTHLMYVKANGTIAGLTGSPIFAFDKGLKTAATVSDDALPANKKYITLPDGTKVIAQTGPATDSQAQVSDFVPLLNDFKPVLQDFKPVLSDFHATLQDFSSTLETRSVAQKGMSDYIEETSALNDTWDDAIPYNWETGDFN